MTRRRRRKTKKEERQQREGRTGTPEENTPCQKGYCGSKENRSQRRSFVLSEPPMFQENCHHLLCHQPHVHRLSAAKERTPQEDPACQNRHSI
ncbi:hypothetical protein PTTG_01028, partial [Puccinia triticina 1-1 BBBD Race 1]